MSYVGELVTTLRQMHHFNTKRLEVEVKVEIMFFNLFMPDGRWAKIVLITNFQNDRRMHHFLYQLSKLQGSSVFLTHLGKRCSQYVICSYMDVVVENIGWFVAKFYDRLRFIRSVLRASKFSVLKLIEIVFLWINYTIPFGSACFGTFRTSFSTFKLLCLAKDHWRGYITRNAHMVHVVNSIRFKMVIHLSRSLFLYCIVRCVIKDMVFSSSYL